MEISVTLIASELASSHRDVEFGLAFDSTSVPTNVWACDLKGNGIMTIGTSSQSAAASQRVSWNAWVRPLLAALLASALLASAWPAAPPLQAADPPPEQAEVSARDPAQTVRVIVKKKTDDGSVEELVAGLGGTVTRDLYIIKSVAAQVPVRVFLPALAAHPGVRWNGQDAPVVRERLSQPTASRPDAMRSTPLPSTAATARQPGAMIGRNWTKPAITLDRPQVTCVLSPVPIVEQLTVYASVATTSPPVAGERPARQT